jgi:hypothetical protein
VRMHDDGAVEQTGKANPGNALDLARFVSPEGLEPSNSFREPSTSSWRVCQIPPR